MYVRGNSVSEFSGESITMLNNWSYNVRMYAHVVTDYSI